MAHQNYDKKIFRLLHILNRLDAGKNVAIPELAGEFNVSLRSVQRDIKLLNETGFPLVARENGKYSFVEGFSLKKAMLSKEEASILSFICDMVQPLGSMFEESFRGILRKVLSQGQESTFYVKMPAGFKLEKDTPFHREIEAAVDSANKVSVDYENQEGMKRTFVVSPLKMIFYDGFWYVLSLEDKRHGLIKLRLDNIKGVQELDESFNVSQNLKAMLDESVNVWFPEERNQRVLLEVSPLATRYFRRKVYFPLQKIVKEHKDGRLILETMVSSQFMEILPTIKQWIPHIKVLSPQSLKAQIKDLISEYQKVLR
ncbi:MAG: hypothetical protein A2036_01720 [Omnitrophica bacterium GWA2_50_21]|nr:MAG: hypothetical protein A2036_01720 [Omnitrophica bacterium GWA2_50_21]